MNKKSALTWWNVFVVFIHSSSFISLLIVTLLNQSTTRYVSLYAQVEGNWIKTGEYALAFTLLPFPLITAIFHIIAACDGFGYTKEVLVEGRNKLRWIEYSITNGLMSWSITMVASDGTSTILAMTTVLSNFIMQYYGYKHEKTRSMVDLLLGFIPWVYNWVIVFVLFGARIGATVGKIRFPVTDPLAIYGSFLWSIAFTLPLFYRYYALNGVTDRRRILEVNFYVELAYILLSLSAKLWLDWVVTGGSLAS